VSLSAALETFRGQHVEVRRAVAFTLVEWADGTTVEVLSRIAEADPESSVRGEAIDALGKIGGPQAVECLKTAARQDPAEGNPFADLANRVQAGDQIWLGDGRPSWKSEIFPAKAYRPRVSGNRSRADAARSAAPIPAVRPTVAQAR
jgi:HEAT repeat protein